MTWFEAMSTAKSSRFLSKSDWGIPTIDEFYSIIGQYDDCINIRPLRAVSRYFPIVAEQRNENSRRNGNLDTLGTYWSTSTTSGSEASKLAEVAMFDYGRQSGISRYHYVTGDFTRLVRLGVKSSVEKFNQEFSKIKAYERLYTADQLRWDRARVGKEQAQVASRTGDYGPIYVHPHRRGSGDTLNYSATCSEGGGAGVSRHDTSDFHTWYYSSGFSNSVGQTDGFGLSVEEAMRRACRGR
jgi:hypothetical protein